MADHEQAPDTPQGPDVFERTTEALQNFLNGAVRVGDNPLLLVGEADKRTRQILKASGHILTFAALPIEQAEELFNKIGSRESEAKVRQPARVLAGSVRLTPQRGRHSRTRRSTPVAQRQPG